MIYFGAVADFGIADTEFDSLPVSSEFTAETLKLYDASFVRPVIIVLVATSDFVIVVNELEPVTDWMILYEIIGEPLLSGAVQDKWISSLPGIAIRSVIGSGTAAVWAKAVPSRNTINEMLKTITRKIVLFEDSSILKLF